MSKFLFRILHRSFEIFWGGEPHTRVLGRLISLFMEHRWKLFLAIGCMVGYNIFTAAPAWYIKDVVDALKAGNVPDIQRFVLVGLAVVIIFGAKGFFYFGQNYLMGLVAQRLVTTLRMRLYAHMQNLPLSFFTRHASGDLIARFTSDLLNLQNALRISVAGPLRDIPQIGLFLTILVLRSWELFLVSVIIIPVALALISMFGRRNNRLTSQRLTTFGAMTSLVMETVNGIRVVKAFGMEKYEQLRFQKANEELLHKNMRTIRVTSYSTPILETIGAFAAAGIIMFGGYLIIHHRISPGDFVSFLLAFFMLNEPIKKLNGFNLKVQEGMASAQRVFDLMLEPTEVDNQPGATVFPPLRQSLRIRIPRFSYIGSTTPVLKDIELEVKRGEAVALVGASGGGKSTLVNLIPRFYELREGEITLDGQDIRQADLNSWRRQIAIVTQEVFLFNDTVANNIDYGNNDYPRERLIEAAKAAQAHDFIMALPEGYDTQIGQGGMTLSGGQRQRLAIARALIKDAPLLILDEATSALDSESEVAVQRAIDALLANRTTIVIAHRLSTIRRAHQICVMEKGSIVEQGKHEELLARGGVYHRLYEAQFKEHTQEEPQRFRWQRIWQRVKGEGRAIGERQT